MKTKIYVLCESNGEIRYVGKTSYSLSVRLGQHLSYARYGKRNYLYNWIRSIFSTGHLPTISLIGEVEGDGCGEEIAWIAYGRAEGWRLVNATAGGEGILGYKHTEATRIRLSNFFKGRLGSWIKGKKHSVESQIKMSKSHIGQIPWNKGIHSWENRQHPKGMLGRKQSAETIAKIVEANKGRYCSAETRRKMGEAQKQRPPFSEETRLRMSGHIPWNKNKHTGQIVWNKGKTGLYHHSEEARRKLSESLKGHIHSAETKQKMSGHTPWNKGKHTGIIPWNKGKRKTS